MVVYTYRKNISPGNEMYMISRFVQAPVVLLMMKPTTPPKNTPMTVNMVKRFSSMKPFFGRVILDFSVFCFIRFNQNERNLFCTINNKTRLESLDYFEITWSQLKFSIQMLLYLNKKNFNKTKQKKKQQTKKKRIQ